MPRAGSPGQRLGDDLMTRRGVPGRPQLGEQVGRKAGAGPGERHLDARALNRGYRRAEPRPQGGRGGEQPHQPPDVARRGKGLG
jgi:hypothetical protein